MYEASQAFHDAVAKGNDQKVLFIFPDCVFSSGDINAKSMSITRAIAGKDTDNTNIYYGIMYYIM